MPCALFDTFGRVHCVTLDRTPGRWKAFQSRVPGDWPFREIQRVSAVDGKRCRAPAWWKAGNPAWGCYRSHLRLIEAALNDGIESILLLEDDAVFCDDFAARVTEFLKHVPGDWGILYLGGQHLRIARNPPKKVNEHVYRPYNVNRTHAFALRGPTMLRVYQHLCHTTNWQGAQHVDHHLGRLHQRRKDPIYCPREWLVGQEEGRSTISNKTPPRRFWQPAAVAAAPVAADPFVAVVGLHSSGSSCTAGVLYHLGLHLGNDLVGHYGQGATVGKGGYEARGLAQICEAAIPFPATEYSLRRGRIWSRLRKWIQDRQREAKQKKTVAGGKYPHLCRLGDQLVNISQHALRVVNVVRPIDESIASLAKRCPTKNAAKLEAHQRWLDKGRQDLLDKLTPEQRFDVDYHELLAEPREVIERLAEWLPVDPTDSQIATAVEHVDPSQRHVLSQDNQPSLEAAG